MGMDMTVVGWGCIHRMCWREIYMVEEAHIKWRH